MLSDTSFLQHPHPLPAGAIELGPYETGNKLLPAKKRCVH
jgi:hypothetical protein